MTKRATIVALVGVNLLLLAALIVGSYSLPAAHAQPRSRAGDFVSVTAGVTGQSYDVLYVLDVPERTLHAFVPTIPSRELEYAGSRNLADDFRQ